MDVEASRAIRQAEVSASQTMIERTEASFGINPNGSWRTPPMAQPPTSTGWSTRGSHRNSYDDGQVGQRWGDDTALLRERARLS